MTLPKHIQKRKKKSRVIFQILLIHAFEIAWEALGRFADYDKKGNKNHCDFHLRHDEHGWAKDAMRRIEEVGEEK